MFIDEPSSRESLGRMIRQMASNSALRQDLLQEGLVHLWLTEQSRPGQTRSWYLQSCKYHLLHYLAAGRSIDSVKRRGRQWEAEEVLELPEAQEEIAESGESVVGWVSARDILSLLCRQLTWQEQEVLRYFAEGFGPREIGRKLKVSHTLVIRQRRKIASLLNRLETPNRVAIINGGKDMNGFPKGSAPTKSVRGRNGVFHANGKGPNGNSHENGKSHGNGSSHTNGFSRTNGTAGRRSHTR